MPALRIVLVVALVAVSLTEVAENFLDLFLTILLLQLEAGSKFETFIGDYFFDTPLS